MVESALWKEFQAQIDSSKTLPASVLKVSCILKSHAPPRCTTKLGELQQYFAYFLQLIQEILVVRIEMAVQILSVSEELNVLMFRLLGLEQCVDLVLLDSQEMD